MICRIDKVSFDIDGAEIALSTTDKAAAADLWDTLNGKDIKAEYKEYRKHRSLDANAMLWSIIGKMAYELCLSKDEVYRALIKSAGIYTTMAVTTAAVSDLKRMWEHKGLGWQLEIIEENEDMSERFFDLYSDAVSSIQASLPASCESIANRYPGLL